MDVDPRDLAERLFGPEPDEEPVDKTPLSWRTFQDWEDKRSEEYWQGEHAE